MLGNRDDEDDDNYGGNWLAKLQDGGLTTWPAMGPCLHLGRRHAPVPDSELLLGVLVAWYSPASQQALQQMIRPIRQAAPCTDGLVHVDQSEASNYPFALIAVVG